MKFRPLHDRVVVKRLDAEEKSAGGIIIPDNAKEKPSQGELVAVGPGGRDEAGKLIPIDLKVGDRVLFGKWSGTEVKIDGELRSRRRTPSACSRSLIALETAGWEVARRSAALCILPA
jgi:chaperonin GroES